MLRKGTGWRPHPSHPQSAPTHTPGHTCVYPSPVFTHISTHNTCKQHTHAHVTQMDASTYRHARMQTCVMFTLMHKNARALMHIPHICNSCTHAPHIHTQACMHTCIHVCTHSNQTKSAQAIFSPFLQR